MDDAGLTENTHVLFFSDHGDMHGSHGMFRKTTPHEEALRVPFVIGGGLTMYGVGRGSRPAPVNHVDVAPTSLGLCGIDPPDWMRGTDYAGHRTQSRDVDAPDSAFCQLVVPTGHANSTDRPWRAVVTDDGETIPAGSSCSKSWVYRLNNLRRLSSM